MTTRSEEPRRLVSYDWEKRLWEALRSKWAIHGFLILTVAFVLLPNVWMFISSLKDLEQVFDIYTYLPPTPVEGAVAAYGDALFVRGYWQAVVNSFTIAVTATVVVLGLGVPAGYVFSRYRFRGDSALFLGVIVTRLFPPIGLLVPYYQVLVWLDLINTRTGIIIANVYLWLPLAIYTMRNFYMTVPKSIDEAAKVDGCTDFQAFRHVVLPLVAPGVASTAILTFLFSWREFVFALIIATGLKSVTLPVAIYQFVGDIQIFWHSLSAVGMMTIFPAVIVVWTFQQYIVRGLTGGAVKE